MKKVLRFLALFIIPFSSFGQIYLDENFNSGIPATFQVQNGGSTQTETWLGTNFYKENGVNRSLNGTPFAFCNGDPAGPGSEADEYLTSPGVNTQAAPQVILEFIHYYRKYLATDSAEVEIFDGSDWVQLAVYKGAASAPQHGSWAVPEKVRINVTQYKNPAMKVRFHFAGIWPWYWAVDNLRIYAPLAKDLSVSSVVAPASLCNLGTSTQLTVKVTNFGTLTQSNFPVSYQVNGGAVVTQQMTTSVFPGQDADFTFTQPINLSTPGSFRVNTWTGLAGDLQTDNDTLKGFTFTRYTEGIPKVDFTNYSGIDLADVYPGWSETRGRPAAGTVSNWTRSNAIQEALLGSATAKVNLLARAQKEYLVGPALTPTSSSGVIFKAAVTDWQNGDIDYMGADDSLKVLVSTNCGLNWRSVFAITAATNLGNHLTEFIVPLAQYAGQEIRIAIYATDGNSDNEEDYEIHVDDIEVVSLPSVDLGVSLIKSPLTACGLTNQTPVRVSIRNFGSQTQRQFPVKFKFNNQAAVVETFADSIRPNEVKDFTFTTPSNIGNPGIYNLKVWTDILGDAKRFNDSITNFRVENTIAIGTFPYNETFENGPAGWTVGTIPGPYGAPTWALGTPQKAVISSPAQGANSWVTGGLGTGTYNSNEKSFVLAPCFDFTSLVNPVIELKIWWHSEFSVDGAVLQYSKNGGANWFNVGEFGDPNNWYNDNTVAQVSQLANPQHAWSGGQGTDIHGSGGWVIARNFLKGLGGLPLVKLRVVFGSNSIFSGDGFGFDDVKIYEAPTKDVELTSITSPSLEACSLGTGLQVKIKVTNKGRIAISNIPVHYRVNQETIVNEIMAGPLDTNQTAEYTFSQLVNITTVGQYNLQAWASVQEDAIPSNDSIRKYRLAIYDNAIDTVTFTGYNGVNLNELYTGFREAKGFPQNPVGSFSAWGPCTASQAAFLGSQTAKMYVFASVNREWLITPQVNAESSTRLTFRAAVTTPDNVGAVPMGDDDTLKVLVSTNCGLTWQLVRAITKDSNLTNAFRTFRVNLAAFAGQRIQVAFYGTDGTSPGTQYDLHLDNILIIPSPAKDLALTGFANPTNGCGLGSAEIIKVKVFNNGSATQSAYTLNYRINNGPVQSQPVTTSIASGEIQEIAFTQTSNMASAGTYNIRAWLTLTGDLVTVNDSARITIRKYSTPTPLLTFNGYGGQNLSEVSADWSEASGSLPSGSASKWDALGLGSNTVAKIFISGSANPIHEWIISPPVRLGGAPQVTFKAGLRLPGTNTTGQLDIDDFIYVMATADCGQTWDTVFAITDTIQPALTAALQTYTVNLSAYENQEIRLGFHATDGNRIQFSSDFLLDDVRITSTAAFTDMGIVQLLNPGSQLVSGVTYPLRIRVKNFGNSVVNEGVIFAFIGETNFSASVVGPIAPGASKDVDINDYTPSEEGPLTGTIIIQTQSDVEANNDTLRLGWNVLTGNTPAVKGSAVRVYPVPASEIITVKVDTDEFSSCEILNLVGQAQNVSVLEKEKQFMVLNIRQLPPGLYTVKCRLKSSVNTMRFLKK